MIGKLNVSYPELKEFCNEHLYDIQLPRDIPLAQLPEMKAVEPIGDAQPTDVTFCRFEDERAISWIKSTSSRIVFIPSTFRDSDFLSPHTTYVFAEHPRLALLNFIVRFWSNEEDNLVDPFTDVHPSAKIGANVKIGKYCTIGADVKIGDNTTIENNTTIMHATIGHSCKIGSCVTIGGDGFGFEDDNEEVLTFPHLGGVKIGNHVRIGSSCCIDRASLGNTKIEDNVKLDNLIHVAHNVSIGASTKVTAMTIIAGSTKIGKNVWIAPGTSMRDWITIGDNTLIGTGSVLTRDVEDNKAVFGNPARPIPKPNSRYR